MCLESLNEKFNQLLEEIQNSPEKNRKNRVEQIISIDEKKWYEFPPDVYLNFTGYIINSSLDLKNKNWLKWVIDLLSNHFLERDIDPRHFTRAHFQLSNSELYKKRIGSSSKSGIDDRVLFEALKHLRKAANIEGLKGVENSLENKIRCNLGDTLLRSGRVIEAMRYWDEVIDDSPSFGMAFALRGRAKVQYGDLVYYNGQKNFFFHSAYKDLEKALKTSDLHKSHRKYFGKLKKRLEPFIQEERSLDDLKKFSMGETEQEKKYKKWCLDNILFLNPLNDILCKSIAAHDVLHLPNMHMPEDNDFPYPGLFNQMKQEYVSARFIFYEGVTRNDTHYSDKDVKLINTLDYPEYSYSIEQMKAGLRLAYSIFSKIALFLNHYFDLGFKPYRVKLSSIWYKGGHQNNGMMEVFEKSENWPLKALYWIKKDFYESDLNVDDSIDLIADDIKNIRNHLEHKYLKVHESNSMKDLMENKSFRDTVYENELRFSIGKGELLDSGYAMLKLARAGLIYISLSIHFEEQKHSGQEDTNGVILPIYSDIWEDSWKR